MRNVGLTLSPATANFAASPVDFDMIKIGKKSVGIYEWEIDFDLVGDL